MAPKETQPDLKTPAGLLYLRVEFECICESSHKFRDVCVLCLVLLDDNKEHLKKKKLIPELSVQASPNDPESSDLSWINCIISSPNPINKTLLLFFSLAVFNSLLSSCVSTLYMLDTFLSSVIGLFWKVPDRNCLFFFFPTQRTTPSFPPTTS